MGEYELALQCHEKARKAQCGNGFNAASNLSNIGLAYSRLCDFARAIEYLSRALKMRQSMDERHHSVCESYSNLATVYIRMGDVATACSYYDRALALGASTRPQHNLVPYWISTLKVLRDPRTIMRRVYRA